MKGTKGKMTYDSKLVLIFAGVSVFVILAAFFALWVFRDMSIDALNEKTLQTAQQELLKPLPEATPTPTPAPTPTPTPVHNVKMTFVGDLMVHQDQMDAAFVKETGDYDFDHSLSKVAPYLQKSDVAIGNLETVLAGEEVGYSDFPSFCAPDQFGEALKRAGFDLLTTANNHSNDKREAGILRTLDVIDALSFEHFGTYSSQEARDTVFIKEINNIKFAFLSYTYGTNGLLTPKDKEYLVNLLDKELIKEDIARAKALDPDFIIVMPHMGNEYELYPTDMFKNWANIMFSSGADIVIASHPHVIQPMEFVTVTDDSGETRDCFVAYSMGNFVSSQRTQPREAGLMLNLYYEKIGDEKAILKEVSYSPTWVKFTDASGKRDIVVLPVADIIKAYEAGENVDLRPKDINRVKAVHKEIAETVLGHDISPSDIAEEYFLKNKD